VPTQTRTGTTTPITPGFAVIGEGCARIDGGGNNGGGVAPFMPLIVLGLLVALRKLGRFPH
jgi:hypothetical protein